MSDPFLGQIMMAGFGFAPYGYALCNGAELRITQNAALFALIHNQFGGDGKATFMLPDLRGRTFVGFGTGESGTFYPIAPEALAAGKEQVTLKAAEVPPHSHAVRGATSTGSVAFPGAVFASAAPDATGVTHPLYATPGDASTLVALSNQVSSVGGGGSHKNMQPSVVVNFAIAIIGTYPPRQ